MERLKAIIKDIEEKEGKEWIGLQSTTEKQLEHLRAYLNHPKVQENSKLSEELIELYYLAKESSFMKMEGIIRKIDQLSVTLGVEFTEAKEARGPIGLEIKELKQRVGDFLHSTSGSSIPESSQKSLITFLNYLNHPDLQNREKLFEEMLDKYNVTESGDFISMQALNDLLNKLEIKLGAVTEELKTYKSLDEVKKELEEEKEKLAVEWEKLEEERKRLEAEQEKLDSEKKEVNLAKEKVETERKILEDEQEKLDSEKKEVNLAKEEMEAERNKLEAEKKAVDLAKEEMETERNKLEAEKKAVDLAKEKMEAERKILEAEKEKLKEEP